MSWWQAPALGHSAEKAKSYLDPRTLLLLGYRPVSHQPLLKGNEHFLSAMTDKTADQSCFYQKLLLQTQFQLKTQSFLFQDSLHPYCESLNYTLDGKSEKPVFLMEIVLFLKSFKSRA